MKSEDELVYLAKHCKNKEIADDILDTAILKGKLKIYAMKNENEGVGLYHQLTRSQLSQIRSNRDKKSHVKIINARPGEQRLGCMEFNRESVLIIDANDLLISKIDVDEALKKVADFASISIPSAKECYEKWKTLAKEIQAENRAVKWKKNLLTKEIFKRLEASNKAFITKQDGRTFYTIESIARQFTL